MHFRRRSNGGCFAALVVACSLGRASNCGAVRCCAVHREASSWPCRSAALRCGLICQAFMFYGVCSALCLSARLLSEPFIPGPQRQARRGAAGPGEELLQRHGVVRTSQLVVPTGQVDGMPQHLAEKTTANREEQCRHTLRRGGDTVNVRRRASDAAEALGHPRKFDPHRW